VQKFSGQGQPLVRRFWKPRDTLWRWFTSALLSVYGAGSAAGQDPPSPGAGAPSGNYEVQQTFELGYRWTNFTGHRASYNTFVNLNPGPRLLEQTLQARSRNHAGRFFDHFFVSSFGYGGDPNNITQLRAYKNGWYNLDATYRRDRNFWDYDLLANPLNPAGANPSFPVPYSPHRFEVSRRMSNWNLTLLPQSRVRFRFGYTRNRSDGSSLSTFGEGTTALLLQRWDTLENGYRIGADVALWSKTSVSYDQFLQFDDTGTSWDDPVGSDVLGLPRFLGQLADGTAVDPGLVFNPAAGQPCFPPVVINSATTPPTISDTCAGFLQYRRAGAVRTFAPTEQMSFQSDSLRGLNLSGRVAYSSLRADVENSSETFLGLLPRTLERQFDRSGPARARRVSVTADLGATVRVRRFRVSHVFRFAHFRVPGRWDSAHRSSFPASSPPSLLGAIASFPASTPLHNLFSPADSGTETFHRFLGEKSKSSRWNLQHDFSKRLGANLGYRFRCRKVTRADGSQADLLFLPFFATRGVCSLLPSGVLPPFCAQQPDGSIRGTPGTSVVDEATLDEHAGLGGLWARPTEQLRLNFDLELQSADRALTRISPRQLQRYRFRAGYKPAPWASLTSTLNITESRNKVLQVNHEQHHRAYGFAAALGRQERGGLDLGYHYNSIFSSTLICYSLTPNPVVLPPCLAGIGLSLDTSAYESRTHYAYFDATWRPTAKLSARLGYSITRTRGSTLLLPSAAPAGPLAFDYHRPYAGLSVGPSRGVTFKVDWALYGYSEGSAPGPSGSHTFAGHTVTTAVRFSF